MTMYFCRDAPLENFSIWGLCRRNLVELGFSFNLTLILILSFALVVFRNTLILVTVADPISNLSS